MAPQPAPAPGGPAVGEEPPGHYVTSPPVGGDFRDSGVVSDEDARATAAENKGKPGYDKNGVWKGLSRLQEKKDGNYQLWRESENKWVTLTPAQAAKQSKYWVDTGQAGLYQTPDGRTLSPDGTRTRLAPTPTSHPDWDANDRSTWVDEDTGATWDPGSGQGGAWAPAQEGGQTPWTQQQGQTGGQQQGEGPPAWLTNSAMAEPQGGWSDWWSALTPEQRTHIGSQTSLQGAYQNAASMPESPGGGYRSPTGNYVPEPRSEWEARNPVGSPMNQPNKSPAWGQPQGQPQGMPYQPLGAATGLPPALRGHAPPLDLEALSGAGPATPFHWSQAEYMPAWGQDPLPDMERAALPRQQNVLPTMGQPQMPTMPPQMLPMQQTPAGPPQQPPPAQPGFGPPARVRGQFITDYIGNPPLDDNALDEILGQIV